MDYGLGPENDECKDLIDNGEARGVRHADHGELGQQLQQHKYKAGVTSVDMFATTSDEREDELAAARTNEESPKSMLNRQSGNYSFLFFRLDSFFRA